MRQSDGASGDGYTFLIDSVTIAQNASLYRNAGFSAANDLTPMAHLMELPFIVAVNRRTPARTIAELMALAKAQQGVPNVAESCTSPRLVGEFFRQVTGTDFTFVPYLGRAPSVAGVLSGEVPIFFSDLPSIAPFAQRPDSPVAALAITSRLHSPVPPDVSTARELGMPDFETMSRHVIFAPRNTPMPIVVRMHRELNAALEKPEVCTRLSALSAFPAPLPQAEFAAFYQAQIVLWQDVIRRAGMTAADQEITHLAVAGSGAIVIWNNVRDGMRDLVTDWHDRDHIPERTGIPGFLRGRRFAAKTGSSEFLILYQTADGQATQSPAYFERLNNPSAWTARTKKNFIHTIRGTYPVGGSVGIAEGGCALILRLGPPEAEAAQLDERVAEALPALLAGPGIVAAHWLVVQQEVSLIETTERIDRASLRAPNRVLVIEGHNPARVAAACERTLPDVGGNRGIYTLEVARAAGHRE